MSAGPVHPDQRPPRPGRPVSNRELVEHLCDSSPSLRESLRLHVERYGTLVPHFFMEEVLVHVGRCRDALADAASPRRTELESILATLEQCFAAGDRETRNVIALSFMDDLEQEPFFSKLRPMLGPHLLAQVQGK